MIGPLVSFAGAQSRPAAAELKKGTRGWAKLVVRILVMYIIAVKKPSIVEFFMLTNLNVHLLKTFLIKK